MKLSEIKIYRDDINRLIMELNSVITVAAHHGLKVEIETNYIQLIGDKAPAASLNAIMTIDPQDIEE